MGLCKVCKGQVVGRMVGYGNVLANAQAVPGQYP